jgi:hypothetical protein
MDERVIARRRSWPPPSRVVPERWMGLFLDGMVECSFGVVVVVVVEMVEVKCGGDGGG